MLHHTHPTLCVINTAELSEKGQWLKDLLPKNTEVMHIKRKPKYRKKLESTQIFKDGLYGERFMSILLDDEKLYYGFACISVIELGLWFYQLTGIDIANYQITFL
jgi:hypothetical protein